MTIHNGVEAAPPALRLESEAPSGHPVRVRALLLLLLVAAGLSNNPAVGQAPSAGDAEAQTVANPLDDATRAIEILREAASVLSLADGPEVLRIEFGFAGPAWFPYQGPTPESPGRFDYIEETAVALNDRQMTVTSGFTGGETAFSRTMEYDGTSVQDQPALSRQLRQSPHAIINAWLETPRSLFVAAESPSHWTIAGPFYGVQIYGHINRETYVVDKVDVPFNDVRYGDALASLEFLDYRADASDRQVPARLRVTEAGNRIFDLPYSHYRLLSSAPPDPDERAQEPPRDDAAAARGDADDDRADHRDVADGVRILFDTGGPDYHSLAVTTDDGVVVVEAPGSVAAGQALAERASELGEIRYVAATHHHGDHTAGLPGAMGAESVIVAAAAHRAFFQDMVTAERHFLPAEHRPAADPEFETVSIGGSTSIGGGRVIAYDAGPTGHSDAQLVFYVPDAKLLFQSDMAVFSWDGSVETARTQTCRLKDFIDETGMEIDIIVGGHGRPGTMADLEQAIAQRAEDCNLPQ